MKNIKDHLVIDPQEEIRKISFLIKEKYLQLNRRMAIIGLSGGLDSSLAAVLAAKSLGTDKLVCYYLPDRDSKTLHKKHAHLLADQFGLKLKTIQITPILRALRIYSLLPLNIFLTRGLRNRVIEYGKRRFLKASQGEFLRLRLAGTGGSWVARGNAYASSKHRVRSVVLYREAELNLGLVIGAANRTELMTGTFTQWGCDHNADVMPLAHLYRSQLQTLAEYLDLPEQILHKKADPDVLPGLDDKGELLGSFQEADQILWGLEHHVSLVDLKGFFDPDLIDYLNNLHNDSAYYRETPYSLL
jgi:NAD+ synthase